jgi:micrococcal nuclease
MSNRSLNNYIQVFIFGLIVGIGFLIFTGYKPDLGREVLAAIGFGDGRAGATQSKKSSNSTNSPSEKVTVLRVVDGDTIELDDGRKVRYLNIDTPETVKPNTPVMCFGLSAKEYNKSFVDHKNITLVYDRDRQDRYGRTLAFIFLEGADINNIEDSLNYSMVKKGYAKAVFYAPNTTYKAVFQSAMQDAIDNKAGAWKDCPKPFQE